MAIKILIFDFDGTIVDSNEIKNGAYLELFPLANQKTKELIGKISYGSRKTRYQIIGEILSTLKEIGEISFSDIEKEIERRAEQYGEIVKREILKNNGVVGAFNALWFYFNNKYALYLLSGTPLRPLQQIVEKMIANKKIPPFKKIYGRIDDIDEVFFKKQVLTEIIKLENVLAREIVMVGDGESERNAALGAGCNFVGITNKSNGWEKNDIFPVFIDFKSPKLFLEIKKR